MKKIFIAFSALVLFSCGTTKTVVDTKFTEKETEQSAPSMSFPQNDGVYAEAYSWRTNHEENAMVALKNSDVDSLRFSSVELYISRVVNKINGAANTDFEKAKMAHDIIALTIRYDAQGYWSGNTPAQDYVSVLQRGTAVCEGFSNVYKKLCDMLGIPCRVVHGYARGVGTKAGSELSTLKSNHAWNIITIKGRQYQVDCTWDEGYMNGRNATHEYVTVWLFAQPEAFIFTHFPEYSADQLLSNPISYQKFLQLPSLRPNFFDAVKNVSDFRIVNNCNGTFSLKYSTKNAQKLSCSVRDSSGSLVTNASFTKTNGENSEMLFSLPSAEKYEIALFQQSAEMEKAQFCGEFLLFATDSSAGKFPTVFSNYGLEKDGVVLSPISTLVRGETYFFRVQSKSSAVAIVMDKQWVHLSDDGAGIFTGEATIPENAQKVTVNVKNASGQYWSIVSYVLK